MVLQVLWPVIYQEFLLALEMSIQNDRTRDLKAQVARNRQPGS